MARQITYYFSLLSPWAYIGHAAFVAMAKRHDAAIDYHPVNLMDVFPETGGLPLPKRHPSRQRYRMLELQRWRARRNLDFNLQPKFWPFDVTLADRFVIAVVDAGQDPDAFLRLAFSGVWEKQQNLATEETIADLGRTAGLDAARFIERAKSAEIAAKHAADTRAAIAADAFGSPVYVLDGEVFWGQDRIDLLDDALTSGRAPYRAAG